MEQILQRTELSFDLERARSALGEVTRRYPFDAQRRQISLMHQSATQQSVEDGVGTLFDAGSNQWKSREEDFRFFNREFGQSYFAEIVREAQEQAGLKIGRVRIMNLGPRTCYSLHDDPTMRYHLALHTNPHAIFVFPNSGVFSIPADGAIYRVDTRQLHTAMNGGLDDRIHLVLSEAEQ